MGHSEKGYKPISRRESKTNGRKTRSVLIEEKRRSNQLSKKAIAVLDCLSNETIDLLLSFTSEMSMKKVDRLLKTNGSKLTKLCSEDIVAFRKWETTRFTPYIKNLRLCEIERSIPSQPAKRKLKREFWSGTLTELAELAVDLCERGEHRNLGVACKALVGMYTFEGKSINYQSLYGRARQINAQKNRIGVNKSK